MEVDAFVHAFESLLYLLGDKLLASERDSTLLDFLLQRKGFLLGAWRVTILALPAVLGAAAGAMLYIISDEIIPETHRRGFETPATFALMTGMVVMMFLDTTLG